MSIGGSCCGSSIGDVDYYFDVLFMVVVGDCNFVDIIVIVYCC